MLASASLEELFQAALEHAPDQRAAFLVQACPDQPDLRRDVERLLSAQERMGDFLQTSPTAVVEAAKEATVGEPVPLVFLGPPTQPQSLGRLAHYEFLETIGGGGFGMVFRAYDEKLQRIVAIKVLAPALAASAPARKRFTREAQ